LRVLSFLWELSIMLITFLAGNILSSGIVSRVKRSLTRNPKR
jgi:hypothetical protein